MHTCRYSTLSLWLRYINRDAHVIGLVALLLVGCFFSFFLAIVGRQLAFIANSEVVTGHVLGKHKTAGLDRAVQVASIHRLAHGKRGPRYIVQYEYTDSDGVRHRGSGSLSVSQWMAAKPGDPIAVRYDRRDPAASQLDNQLWNFWPALFIVVAGLAIGSLVAWVGIRGVVALHRKIGLIKTGDATPGRITYAAIETRGTRRKSSVAVLKYEFLADTLQQETLELAGPLRSNWQAGRGIVILVDPNDRTRHAPDIFDARHDDRMLLFGSDDSPG